MPTHDSRVDAYIAKSADFARPILEHRRAAVQRAWPEVEEGIKWSMPFFSCRGAPMGMRASFARHGGFGFWLSREVTGGSDEDGMGQLGKLSALNDLPSHRQLAAWLKEAVELNEKGVRRIRANAATEPAPILPDDPAALLALKRHDAERRAWENFSPGARREYVDWIVEAKTDATRQKRIATPLEWLAEGRQRSWKYQKC